jgi:glycerate 2-kinase
MLAAHDHEDTECGGVDLRQIYLETLARCAPEKLVRPHVTPDLPRNVVAIGKCAGSLLDGVASVHDIEHAFVAIPEGYKLPSTKAEVHLGGHPQMIPSSFAAGRALITFVERHDDILFLISGGGSACVEVPLAPHDEQQLIDINARLIASGLPIESINAERKKLSAIKDGRLGDRVRGQAVTFVYSDTGATGLRDVASGPSYRNMRLIADNQTLVRTAAEIIGTNAVVIEGQLEGDVLSVAQHLARNAQAGKILVAGGEPTVRVKGNGRGGRCSELAVHFARISGDEALFASSDGVDGNSGAAGVHLPHRGVAGLPRGWEAALEASDSMSVVMQVGEPIMITPTGNNLRDLFLVARDSQASAAVAPPSS